ERQLLDARKEHAVQMILAPEILLAVLEEPPRERQQQPPLDEENETAGRRAVRRKLEMRAKAPLDVAVEELREEHRVEIAFLDGTSQHRVHRLEEGFVLVLGDASALDQVLPQPRANLALDVVHHGVDAQLRFGHPSLRGERQQYVAGDAAPQRVA